MTPRFQFAITILVASAFTVGCAQTKPLVPRAQEHNPVEAPKLQQIVPNPKWTLSQNSAQLLLLTHVQHDIALSPETKAGILKVYGEYNAKYTELTKGPPSDDLEAKLDAATLEVSTKAVALLSPEQLARLDQLGVQAMELEALRLSDVRTRLALTADESAQFDKMFAELDAKQLAFDSELGDRMSKIPEPGPNGTAEQRSAQTSAQKAILDDMEPRSKALEDLRKSDLVDLVDKLTPEQKATWQTMVGAPLKG